MLMAYPFFSLAKTPRITPIRFQSGTVTTRVAGTLAHGMATIWDADILIWVTSQIVGARNAGLPTSRLVVATPYDILTYIGRGTSRHDYERLRGADNSEVRTHTIFQAVDGPVETWEKSTYQD